MSCPARCPEDWAHQAWICNTGRALCCFKTVSIWPFLVANQHRSTPHIGYIQSGYSSLGYVRSSNQVSHSLLLLATGASTSGSSTVAASGQASKPSSEPAQVLELDANELLTYKRRLLDLLQPHETVLAALRRLGGRQEASHGGGADALPWKRARKSAGTCLLSDSVIWAHAWQGHVPRLFG